MAITYNAPTPYGATGMEISGTTDQAVPVPLRFYRDGAKFADYISQTQSWSRIIQVPSGESPTIEVLDKANAVPSPAFPGRITLNWRAVAGAAQYVVEEYYSAVWTERATIRAESRTAFRWRTRHLEDETSFQFRVTPYDDAGGTVTPLTFSFLVVRRPDVPNVAMTYSSLNQKVTISAV